MVGPALRSARFLRPTAARRRIALVELGVRLGGADQRHPQGAVREPDGPVGRPSRSAARSGPGTSPAGTPPSCRGRSRGRRSAPWRPATGRTPCDQAGPGRQASRDLGGPLVERLPAVVRAAADGPPPAPGPEPAGAQPAAITRGAAPAGRGVDACPLRRPRGGPGGSRPVRSPRPDRPGTPPRAGRRRAAGAGARPAAAAPPARTAPRRARRAARRRAGRRRSPRRWRRVPG